MAVLVSYGQADDETKIRSTKTMQDDHLRARHSKKQKGRTAESRKWKVMELELIKRDVAL